MGTLVKSGEMASLGGKVRYKGAFRPLLVCYGPIYVHGWPFMCTCSVKVWVLDVLSTVKGSVKCEKLLVKWMTTTKV